MKSSRRMALKTLTGTALSLPALTSAVAASPTTALVAPKLKGNINHSVCRWCYSKTPFEELCKAAKEIGIKSIELVDPPEWPILKKYGLTSALPQGAGKGIVDGFNDPKNHDELVASYEAIFPKLKEAGYSTIICFSGNRRGMSDEEGMKNCAVGLKRLMPSAEKYGITMIMELLNSKVDHKDYMCDHTAWGAELCKLVGSERFKLLYDIYHMQIMEGDLARTIEANLARIAHVQLADNPGRFEPGTGEINYPFLFKHLDAIGYSGWVGCEYKPKTTTDEGLGWFAPYRTEPATA